jgi:hypothetical protein
MSHQLPAIVAAAIAAVRESAIGGKADIGRTQPLMTKADIGVEGS